MNISQITYLKAEGEIAARTEQSTYWLCYDMIRTEILKCSEGCRKCKVGTTVWFKSGRKTRGVLPVQVTARRLSPVWGSLVVPNQDWGFWVSSNPELLLTLPYSLPKFFCCRRWDPYVLVRYIWWLFQWKLSRRCSWVQDIWGKGQTCPFPCILGCLLRSSMLNLVIPCLANHYYCGMFPRHITIYEGVLHIFGQSHPKGIAECW